MPVCTNSARTTRAIKRVGSAEFPELRCRCRIAVPHEPLTGWTLTQGSWCTEVLARRPQDNNTMGFTVYRAIFGLSRASVNLRKRHASLESFFHTSASVPLKIPMDDVTHQVSRASFSSAKKRQTKRLIRSRIRSPLPYAFTSVVYAT